MNDHPLTADARYSVEADLILVRSQRTLSKHEIRLLDGQIETWPDLADGLAVSLVGGILQHDEPDVETETVEATAYVDFPEFRMPATWRDLWKRDVGLRLWDRLTRHPSTRLGRWVRRRTRPVVRWSVVWPARREEKTERRTVTVSYDRRICPHGALPDPRRHAEFLIFGRPDVRVDRDGRP